LRNQILIVDDEASIRTSLKGVLQDEGYEVRTAQDGHEALEMIKADPPDLVMLDIWMPGLDGIETLGKIKELAPEVEVVMISGHGTVETAVKTTKLGAYDFLEKPLSLEKTVLIVQHALDKKRLEQENIKLRREVEKDYEMIGRSQAIQELKKQVERVAPTEGWVLIYGENGAGKELIARAIHRLSQRKAGSFVAVNCAAIPDELIESELFGHEKGAFTGAATTRYGKFEQAHGGTLFLDEIGDMSLKTQSKVLRVIEEQAFERVGGSKKIQVDVRLIAASNKDLEQEIKAGNFREDLFYRLNVVPLVVPPLRERREDIPLLAEHFLRELSYKNGTKPMRLSKPALKALMEYNWPGNVREFKNILERMVIMVADEVIQLEHIPPAILKPTSTAPWAEKAGSLKEAREQFEREFLLQKLKENNGNIAQTARQLQIERSHLHRKLKAYDIRLKE
jgi:two-component system nitrogen regulation response regulator NtrX